jgi:hypothetical protein
MCTLDKIHATLMTFCNTRKVNSMLDYDMLDIGMLDVTASRRTVRFLQQNKILFSNVISIIELVRFCICIAHTKFKSLLYDPTHFETSGQSYKTFYVRNILKFVIS